MSNYLINNIQKLEHSVNQGNYLVVLGVGNIPPHIALLNNGTLHSLKVTGYKQEQINDLLLLLNRKNTKCLFFELGAKLKNVETIFSEYESVSKNTSCLVPIKDCLSTYEVNSINFVFDLIEKLKSKKIIVNIFQINLDSEINEGIYKFEKYTMVDINNHIKKLQASL